MSALHKSMRNSDPDASVYWLARMVEAGEDPMYVARRLVRFASEDVGNADPQALVVAMSARDALHFIGMPEGNTALAQAVLYLATAPKSNATYLAYGARRRGRRAGCRRAGAAAPAQRPDPADEVARLRARLPVRARRPRRRRRHGLPAGTAGRPPVLRADRAGLREGDQATPGWVEGDQGKATTNGAAARTSGCIRAHAATAHGHWPSPLDPLEALVSDRPSAEIRNITGLPCGHTVE